MFQKSLSTGLLRISSETTQPEDRLHTDKINCVTIVLSRVTLFGFSKTMVCVRWKNLNGNIITYCTEAGSLRMHKKINRTLVRTSNPSTVGMTSSILKESILNLRFLNVVSVRVYSKKSSVDTLKFLNQGLTTTLCDVRLLEKALELVEKKRAMPLQQ